MTTEELNNLFIAYLRVIAFLAILIVGISFYCTLRAWGFVRKYPGYKLPVVLAVVNTIAFPIALYFGIIAGIRLYGEVPPPWTPVINATLFIILDCIPLITTGYLIWLDHRRTRDRRHPEN